MAEKLDFKAIADAALSRSETLVPDWLPNGVRDGHEWRCGSIKGEAGRSLGVNLVTGQWADFSSDGDRGGDLVSLYAAIFTGGEQGKAARELGIQLGFIAGAVSAAAAPRPVESPSKRPKTTWIPVLPIPEGAGPAPVAHPVRGHAEARWDYHDMSGQLLGHIYRFKTSDGGKEIIPCCWARDSKSGRCEWRWLSFPDPRPLYGVEHFSNKEYVLVVEGEKCVDAARAAMSDWFDVVSWPGGGKAVKKADWAPLAGRKVIIWPDCDSKTDKETHELLPEQAGPGRQGQPGIKAAEDIAAILLGLGCQVRIVMVPTPGTVLDGWDVADALAEGKTGEELKTWVFKSLRDSIHANNPMATPAAEATSSPAPAAAGPFWKSFLIQKPGGGYADCKENVAIALAEHPELKGLVGYNEFSGRIEKLRTPPWVSPAGEWTAEDDLELSMWLGVTGRLLFKSTSTIGEGVRLIASRHKFHPVLAWLESLAWDGEDRRSIWLRDCLGVNDSAYSRLVGSLWLRQAVNRIINPGCKGDYVLILEGVQGLMKSSALRVLGGEWFSDAPLDLNSKDVFMSILGTWIYEIAELDAFNRSESTRIKAFLSQAQDRYRPPYGSRTVTQLRQTVFAATTNNYEYHKDPTGNRRFWSVLCTKVNLKLIAEIRDQLFAQAMHEVLAGEQVYPTREQEATLIVPEQQMRELVDPWHETVAQWLDEPVQAVAKHFTSAQILTGAIKMELAKIDGQRSATTRIGSIMTRLGWHKGRQATGHRLYYYERPEAQEPAPSGSTVSVEHETLPI
ncbi:virulence-associated E family protein [Paralcaligenes ginsengisoli]